MHRQKNAGADAPAFCIVVLAMIIAAKPERRALSRIAAKESRNKKPHIAGEKSEAACGARSDQALFMRRRTKPPRPNKPLPNMNRDAGSGTPPFSGGDTPMYTLLPKPQR